MLLFKLVRRIRRHLANRQALKTLLEADDRLLKDIGVTRGEVIHALQLPLWKDPGETVKRMGKERKNEPARRPKLPYARRSLAT